MAVITRFMWLTDDIAIRDFKSVCRRQRSAVAKMPRMAISIINNA